MQDIIEIPGDVKELFTDVATDGEARYQYLDRTEHVDMDNIDAMQWFLEAIDCHEDNIVCDDGTQVLLKCDSFDFRIYIDCCGLGDFFSHSFDATKEES